VPSSRRQLPEQFRDLEPHLEWALPTAPERRAKRESSTIADLRSFYDTLVPRMEAILAYLARFPLENVPDEVRTPSYLTFALAEIGPTIEMYGEPAVEGLDSARLTHTSVYPANA